MAHIAERQIGYYAAFAYGLEITVLGDPRRLQEAVLEVRPTWFFGVPRIYEKLEATMLAGIDVATQRALDAAVERVRAEQAGQSPPPGSPEDAALLRPLAEATGLDQAEWLGVSGAPCDRALMERFHAVGLRVGELWGLSESVIGTGSAPDEIRLGTAGRPYEGTEIRLGDGIAVRRDTRRSPGVFARTFADVDPGGLLLYEDAGGALAVAVNGGDAAGLLGARRGDELRVERA
jgi:long-subunit acyl-CoA synthetase (AMP-forming)